MLLVSWNVAGRVKALGHQAAGLLALDADLICLQEVTTTTLPVWTGLLGEAAYASVEHSVQAGASVRKRPLLVLTAAREPLCPSPIADVPWPERVLAVRLPDGTEVVNLHSPISPSPALAKVRTHVAVHRYLARSCEHPRVLCGDLNTPRKEHPDGSVWTFARDKHGRLRDDRGAEWDDAELLLLRGLEPYGFHDAFRAIHGYQRREISWGWARWPGGYRLDHLFISGLRAHDCGYRHDWREAGLSDHAALVARLGHAPIQAPRLSSSRV
jgi:exonuclease III